MREIPVVAFLLLDTLSRRRKKKYIDGINERY